LQEAQRKGYTRFIGYSGDSKAARYAVDCGAFDALEISVNIADQEALDLVLPKAIDQALGVIAKRPIANACWRTGEAPESDYHRPYWERLQQLDYPFINGEIGTSIDTALRFTLSVPGVHTAIVGTTKPGRWEENAKLADNGPLSVEQFQDIRVRWTDMARPDWVGQI
jgi:aryl-alcohol dehydrogenase-like predicted oxidoreductase